MKKILTLTFVLAALLLGAVAIQAQPGYKKHKKHKKNHNNYGNVYGDNYNNSNYYPIGYRNGHYNRRGVYVFYKKKRVWKYGRLYKNTYKIKIFPSGRRKVKLINSVPVHSYYGKRVFYRTKIVNYGWRTYRVTYKIIRFPSGRVKRKIVNKVRIYNYYNW